MSIKEEKKKVYVKPTITVAEWDFNEDLCEMTYRASPCINMFVPSGTGIDAIDERGNYISGSDLEDSWHKWPSRN